jgi:hypothetical protein
MLTGMGRQTSRWESKKENKWFGRLAAWTNQVIQLYKQAHWQLKRLTWDPGWQADPTSKYFKI